MLLRKLTNLPLYALLLLMPTCGERGQNSRTSGNSNIENDSKYMSHTYSNNEEIGVENSNASSNVEETINFIDDPVAQEQITRKLAIVHYDPINPSNGESLSSYMGFYSVNELSSKMISDLKNYTSGVVNFTIQNKYVVKNFPKKKDGFRYDWESYRNCIDQPETCHMPDLAAYAPLMNGTDTGVNLCTLISNGTIDEVWVVGAGYFGFDEFAWKIPGDNTLYNTIPYNSWIYDKRRYDLPDCGRPYFVMLMHGGHPPGIHAFGHRIESALTISHAGQGKWDACKNESEWNKFACASGNNTGVYSGCGNVHYPPNALFDYDFSNSRTVQSTCLDWANYPNLRGVTTSISDQSWANFGTKWNRYLDGHISSGSSFNYSTLRTTEQGYKLATNGKIDVWQQGDFNGDGKEDIIQYWSDNDLWSAEVHLSQTQPSEQFFASSRFATKQGGYWSTQKWLVGDFNGDNKDDVAKYWNDNGLWTVDVHKSNGNSFAMERWGTQQGHFWDEQKWVTGDFNGDGKEDFAAHWSDNGTWTVDVHVSNGKGFALQRWATKQGGNWNDLKWYVGDFNGDGKDDFAKQWNDGLSGKYSVDVHRSTGTSFVMERWATKQGDFSNNQRWQVGDFNGDGKDDFGKFWNDGGLWSVDVLKSTGTSFTTSRWASKQGGYWDAQVWTVGDFNGDGKDEYGKYWNDQGYFHSDVHLSNGNSFTMARWATKQSGFTKDRKYQTFWGDFNNDKKMDLVFRRRYNNPYRENTYLNWWIAKIPRAPGFHTDAHGISIRNNWWHYILCSKEQC